MYDDFTLFANFAVQSQAYVLKSFLEDKGIRVILNVSHIPIAFPGMRVGQHDLYVFKEDYERAKVLYEEYKEQLENGVNHEYTDEEFEELAVNSKFEDLDSIGGDETKEFADPQKTEDNYLECEFDDSSETPDDPYYKKGVGLLMSKDLINAKVDDEYNEDKIYKCPNCKNVYLVKEKMQDGLRILFITNYIFMLFIIIVFLAKTSENEEFARNIIKLLPVTVIIMIAHIVTLSKSKFRCEQCGHVEKH